MMLFQFSYTLINDKKNGTISNNTVELGFEIEAKHERSVVSKISFHFYLLSAWIFTFLCEEIRQVLRPIKEYSVANQNFYIERILKFN